MSNTRYKVGDVVRVREGLKLNKIYGDFYVSSDMLKKIGDLVTIKSVSEDCYYIEEFGFCWTDEMLEDIIQAAKNDDKSRIDDCGVYIDISIKNLCDLYNTEVKEVE